MNYAENLIFLAQDAGAGNYAVDPDFLAQLPFWISAAESRICRDLDLLNTYVEDDSGTLSANRRLFTLPTSIGVFQVVSTVRVAGYPPLAPVSREMMDLLYPSDGAVGNPSLPRYWCPLNQTAILIGPAPDQAYQALVWGTQRPVPLSEANPTTFISTWFEDLFHAAQMIDVMAWERQFSATGDEQQGAINWMNEYERLLKSAGVEEAQKALRSAGWASRLPSPTATPPLA